MPWSHEMELPAQQRSARRARDFIRLHLDENGLSYLVDDVELAVSEMATNAIVHAQTSFRVSLQCRDSSVVLTVRDDLTGWLPFPATSQAVTRGRGITIVRGLSRDWGVVVNPGGGKSVWASFETR